MHKTVLLIVAVVVPLLLIVLAGLLPAQWEGVDVVVVADKAQELGAQVRDPFINLEGDALLFAFTMAGAAGGFILGYFWRDLFGAEAMRQRSGKAE